MKPKKFLKGFMTSMLTAGILCTATNVYAANNMAFSAGKGYGGVDVSQATIASYASYGAMGYNSYYATSDATKSVLGGKFTNGTKRLESDIVFLTGHGMWNKIDTTTTGGLQIGSSSASKYVGTNDFDWGKVKLAIFLGCSTGQETSNPGTNLAYNVFEKSNWNITSFGWHQDINHNAAISWIDNFNSKLETGSSVNSAMNYANSKNYVNNSIKDVAFFGNPNLVIKKTRSLTNNKLDESNITYVSENIYFDGKDIEAIINLLEEKFGGFDVNDYKIDIFTNSKTNKSYTIDFTYLIDDIYTNSSYTVIVNNGKVVQIADNTVPVDDDLDINFEDYYIQENWAKLIGVSYTNKLNNESCINSMKNIEPISIRGQKTRKYFNLNKKEKYIQVETKYGYKNSESVAINYYEYKL